MNPIPWTVHLVEMSSTTDGIWIQGTNYLTLEPQPFTWTVSHHGLLWSYRNRYGRFRGAAFGPGARIRLARLLRRARKGGK